MEHTIFGTLQKQDMIGDASNVIVALSGGADSMALFHFLQANRVKLGIRLYAAHFEHGLRGTASLADAAFVANVCRRARVPLFIRHGNMGGKAPPRGQSAEEWARKLRYTFFAELAARHGALVATAHTLNDNAETVLFRSIRGAGPRGLGGIPPVRLPFIRPLIEVSRGEVESYCAAHGVPFVTDTTNFEPQYARNRLRMEVLPVLEEIHPGATTALARGAADMRALDAWLTAQAESLLETALLPNAGAPAGKGNVKKYSRDILLKAPQPVRLQALGLLAGPSASRTTLAGIEAVLAGRQAAQQLDKNVIARVYKDSFVVEPIGGGAAIGWELSLGEGVYQLPGEYLLEVCLQNASRYSGDFAGLTEKSDKKSLTFVADYDRISRNSVWRTRRTGDTFAPAGRGLHKTLKKWMNEAGIPRAERASMPLLAQGSEVLWLWGHGFCEGIAPGENTKTLLVLHCKQPE